MKIFIEKEYSIGGKWVVCDTEETFALLANTIDTVGLECTRDGSLLIYSENEKFHSQWEQVFDILILVGVETIELNINGFSVTQAIKNLGYDTFYGEDEW